MPVLKMYNAFLTDCPEFDLGETRQSKKSFNATLTLIQRQLKNTGKSFINDNTAEELLSFNP